MIPTTLLLATLVNQLIPAARILPLPEVAGGGTGSGGQVIPLVCDAQKTLIVTVSVQGAPPQPFLLDTGASMTTIDERTAADLRLTGAGRIPSLAGSDRLVTAQLTVGPLTLPEGPVATMDFRRLARFLGDVAGILGSDALRAMGGATIDYDRCTLTMGEAPVAPGPVSAMRVPLEWHEGRPVVSMPGADDWCSIRGDDGDGVQRNSCGRDPSLDERRPVAGSDRSHRWPPGRTRRPD